jgi:hypothetical protein
MLCTIWGFHDSDYEECRLLGYKNPVRTSQEIHYVSATESSRLMLRKICGFHGGDYEECRLLGYKNPLRTSQETHYVSATESSRFSRRRLKNTIFWDVTPCGSCKYRCFAGTWRPIIKVTRIRELGTLAVPSNRRTLRRNTKWAGLVLVAGYDYRCS